MIGGPLPWISGVQSTDFSRALAGERTQLKLEL